MPYYTQLIDYARDNQRTRRRGSVHQPVPGPIVVLVVGDQPGEQLDRMYVQIASHWSSALSGLQMCYCYTSQPYTGTGPIHQEKLEIPAAAGAGALSAVPDTLKRVNGMLEKALERMSDEAGLALMRAQIHVVMDPSCNAAPLVTDLIAVCRSQMEELGAMGAQCRLYLMLPDSLKSQQEKENVAGLVAQLPAMNGEPYDQVVAQRACDAQPRAYQCSRLVNTVLLLDEWNENYQRCNRHGERLQLLGDLIENASPMGAFLQTAGVQDSSAGPEYWLAHAMDDLCQKALTESTLYSTAEDRQTLEKTLEQAAVDGMRGMEQALDSCVLFRMDAPFRRLQTMTRDEAEKSVFGSSLELTYRGWVKRLAQAEIPPTVSGVIEQITSDQKLKDLADWFLQKASEYESGTAVSAQETPCGFSVGNAKNATEAARNFRTYLRQTKYEECCRRDRYRICAQMARRCAAICTERIEALRTEREDFGEFAQAMSQAWISQRDGYNGGNAINVRWTGEIPDLAAVRRAGAQAVRTGKAAPAFDLVAGVVDLSGSHVPGGAVVQPLLSCRMTITMGINSTKAMIEHGLSAGRVLRFAELEAIDRSFLIHKALS